MTGQLIKMKIIPCVDVQFNEDGTLSPFTVLVNPEKYSTYVEVQLNYQAAIGSSGINPLFNRILPQTLDFNFIFDGTGILSSGSGFLSNIPLVGPLASNATSTIVEEIENFKNVVITYHGDSHEPRYIKLIWGTLIFKGRLTSLQFDYNLFKPDGTPIRAVANCSFVGAIEENLRVALEQRQSPDITHLYKVNEGDHLDQMSHKIYGDPSFYLEVAKANGLTNFRKLKTGAQLVFPPVEKTS